MVFGIKGKSKHSGGGDQDEFDVSRTPTDNDTDDVLVVETPTAVLSISRKPRKPSTTAASNRIEEDEMDKSTNKNSSISHADNTNDVSESCGNDDQHNRQQHEPQQQQRSNLFSQMKNLSRSPRTPGNMESTKSSRSLFGKAWLKPISKGEPERNESFTTLTSSEDDHLRGGGGGEGTGGAEGVAETAGKAGEVGECVGDDAMNINPTAAPLTDVKTKSKRSKSKTHISDTNSNKEKKQSSTDSNTAIGTTGGGTTISAATSGGILRAPRLGIATTSQTSTERVSVDDDDYSPTTATTPATSAIKTPRKKRSTTSSKRSHELTSRSPSRRQLSGGTASDNKNENEGDEEQTVTATATTADANNDDSGNSRYARKGARSNNNDDSTLLTNRSTNHRRRQLSGGTASDNKNEDEEDEEQMVTATATTEDANNDDSGNSRPARKGARSNNNDDSTLLTNRSTNHRRTTHARNSSDNKAPSSTSSSLATARGNNTTASNQSSPGTKAHPVVVSPNQDIVLNPDISNQSVLSTRVGAGPKSYTVTPRVRTERKGSMDLSSLTSNADALSKNSWSVHGGSRSTSQLKNSPTNDRTVPRERKASLNMLNNTVNNYALPINISDKDVDLPSHSFAMHSTSCHAALSSSPNRPVPKSTVPRERKASLALVRCYSTSANAEDESVVPPVEEAITAKSGKISLFARKPRSRSSAEKTTAAIQTQTQTADPGDNAADITISPTSLRAHKRIGSTGSTSLPTTPTRSMPANIVLDDYGDDDVIADRSNSGLQSSENNDPEYEGEGEATVRTITEADTIVETPHEEINFVPEPKDILTSTSTSARRICVTKSPRVVVRARKNSVGSGGGGGAHVGDQTDNQSSKTPVTPTSRRTITIQPRSASKKKMLLVQGNNNNSDVNNDTNDTAEADDATTTSHGTMSSSKIKERISVSGATPKTGRAVLARTNQSPAGHRVKVRVKKRSSSCTGDRKEDCVDDPIQHQQEQNEDLVENTAMSCVELLESEIITEPIIT